MELFTSEGCSSCPAADAALARIAKDAERSGAPIFTVELHVDYWDYLGWRDPFDDARFSARQAGYRALSGSTYTPQAIVNGSKQAVGSDESRLNELIAHALSTPRLLGSRSPRSSPTAACSFALKVTRQKHKR